MRLAQSLKDSWSATVVLVVIEVFVRSFILPVSMVDIAVTVFVGACFFSLGGFIGGICSEVVSAERKGQILYQKGLLTAEYARNGEYYLYLGKYGLSVGSITFKVLIPIGVVVTFLGMAVYELDYLHVAVIGIDGLIVVSVGIVILVAAITLHLLFGTR